MPVSKITLIPPLVLVLVGAFCWSTAGIATGAASFNDPDQVVSDYPSQLSKIWALCGSAAGLIAYIYFLIRPQEHRPVSPEIAKRFCAPKTLVEAKMGLLLLILALIAGILLPLLFPPKSPITGELIGRSVIVRIFVGCITTVFASGVMVPLSFWLIKKIMLRKQFR